MTKTKGLSWPSIARLGLVQASIGAVVVLMTSTLNRVMVVEFGLAASIPGMLVAIHFFVQLMRPHMGFGSDAHGRRIPWIIGGMALVAVSGIGAAAATAVMGTRPALGVTLAIVTFVLLGIGVSASSTPLLAYLAERTDERRMAGAAAMTWILMIVGIIVTAGVAGTLLDPFSPGRLVAVTAGVSGVAMVLTLLAVVGRPDGADRRLHSPAGKQKATFGETFRDMISDEESRRFATFVFVSMLAYSAQDIILEPFAGAVFGMTPGESTKIAGLQHGGVLLGMILGAVGAAWIGTLRSWSVAGCLGSAVALVGLFSSPFLGSVSLMKSSVFALGFANGVFAVGAIGAMMGLTVRGRAGGAGMRMGFWGAAQAIAYGLGGFVGAAGTDIAGSLMGSPALGYLFVFAGEAALFVAAAALMTRIRSAGVRSGAGALTHATHAMSVSG